ncbi:MAG: hypothetical protein PHS17_06450 [Desulfobacterales bacterium]|nr:hypothetical protein [Desulfobacterales bacterium]
MMEYWNDGMMGSKTGIVNNGKNELSALLYEDWEIFPVFQYSIIPLFPPFVVAQ